MNPLEEVAIDMIGPWSITILDIDYQFGAMTCIYPIINFLEIISVPNSQPITLTHALENEWLIRYPKPRKCIHDNVNEFIGSDFQQMLR